MYSRYNTVCRLIFALSIQYLLLCSSFDSFYDDARHQQGLAHILFIFRQRLPLTRKNNWRLILGLKLEKFKNIEVQQKVSCCYKKVCMMFLDFATLSANVWNFQNDIALTLWGHLEGGDAITNQVGVDPELDFEGTWYISLSSLRENFLNAIVCYFTDKQHRKI